MISFLRHHGLLLRALALALAVASLLLTAPPAFVPTAAADEPVYTTKYIYKWTRYRQHFDVPGEGVEWPCMIIWESGGVYYATLGNKKGDKGLRFYGVDITNNETLKFKPDWKNEKGGNAPPSEFYTEGTMGSWTIIGRGPRDSDDEFWYFDDASFRLSDGTYAYDDDNHLGFRDSSFGWTISGAGVTDGKYATESTYGYASILHIRSGYDRYFDDSKDHLTVNEYDIFIGGFDYDAPDYLMYYGKSREEYSGIGNYTVKSGTTLQIKNNSWLNSGCTITVEPGAVLSISGNFINDGMIANYGTVLLNDGASVYYFGERSSTGGSITNYGSSSSYTDANGAKMQGEGNLLVMSGARLLMPAADSSGGRSYARLKLTKGAALVNYGLILCPGGMEVSDALIQNKASGVICSHCSISGGEYSVKSFTWNNKSKLKSVSGVYDNYCAARSVIENDGHWENYTQCANGGFVEYSGGGTYT